jgi:flagellar hook-basal body complex protein FliE
VINPLDALSTLTQAQGLTPGVGFQPTGPMPTGGTNPASESFNLLQPPAAVGQIVEPTVAPVSGSASPSTWGHMVQQMVMDVNSKQQSATAMVTDVLKGGSTPVHEAMVATEEASLSFQFLAEMRNKVVDAYQQVMQMQV